MKKQFQLKSIALLIGAIAVSGCATQQTWSPELEQARKVYQQASSDPTVSALAASELDQAQKQLKLAEEAADYFKSKEAIAHEATLATLKAQEAQQIARALSVKQDLKLAQADRQAAPTMAAASPSAPQFAAPDMQPGMQPHTQPGMQLGMQPGVQQSSEVQQITQQLAALSNQIAQIQARIAGGALQGSAPAVQAPISHSPISHSVEYQPQPSAPYMDEPALGAARPALQEAQSFAAPEAPAVVSSARLREELRAMNARPSSRGMALTLGERYFESGSARLWNGRAARHLDNIAAVMVENPGLTLDVEAHTDNQGSAEQKNSLTADRAIAIKSALVLRGVNASRINTTGYGDSAPIADNNTQLGQLQNRRVEIIFPNVTAL